MLTFHAVDPLPPYQQHAVADNAHAAFVLQDAASAVERFRAKDNMVLLHCIRANSWTPTVATMYGTLAAGITPMEALTNLWRVVSGEHKWIVPQHS
jgi:ADP-ribosyl-[dinitrogen reductase] hydrolase